MVLPGLNLIDCNMPGKSLALNEATVIFLWLHSAPIASLDIRISSSPSDICCYAPVALCHWNHGQPTSDQWDNGAEQPKSKLPAHETTGWSFTALIRQRVPYLPIHRWCFSMVVLIDFFLIPPFLVPLAIDCNAYPPHFHFFTIRTYRKWLFQIVHGALP